MGQIAAPEWSSLVHLERFCAGVEASVDALCCSEHGGMDFPHWLTSKSVHKIGKAQKAKPKHGKNNNS
jgi:hypothetical protein